MTDTELLIARRHFEADRTVSGRLGRELLAEVDRLRTELQEMDEAVTGILAAWGRGEPFVSKASGGQS